MVGGQIGQNVIKSVEMVNKQEHVRIHHLKMEVLIV
jgi:hypothetical protein